MPPSFTRKGDRRLITGTCNGTVDMADCTVRRDTLGSGTSLPNDETPGVGIDDCARWKAHFGESNGEGSAA